MTQRILILLLCVQPLVWGSTKKGVAHWADNFLCEDFEVLKVNWWYDWRCSLQYFHDNNICASVIDNYESTYIPMIWGFYETTNFACHVHSSSDYILGVNEPNHMAQSYLTPQQAVDDWPKMVAHAGDKILVGPSAAPCGSGCLGNTTEWFDEFFRLCPDCKVDRLATHTYWCGVDKTMNFLHDLYIRYNRTIWLTEFACRDKYNRKDRVLRFMQEILPRLEAAPYIEKYGWYMARIPDDTHWVKSSASLFEPYSSTLTELGQFYNDFV